MHLLFWIAPVTAVAALGFASFFFRQLMRQNEGNQTMITLAGHVRKGALAYLNQQYRVVTVVFLIIAGILAFLSFKLHVLNVWSPLLFLTGGLLSALAGLMGMRTGTRASNRTTYACSQSLNQGLRLAFRSGAVMGLLVVGLGLLGISIWFLFLTSIGDASQNGLPHLQVITGSMLSFGMGASLQALFARVGGGIFTKAADVGADLVGKVEAGIPEDDPRNPATIADNVGDYVGDVAGMGADLYESFCGSILATAALGATAFAGSPETQWLAVIAPMIIAGIGIVCSLIGIFGVRLGNEESQRGLNRALNRGIYLSTTLVLVFGLVFFQATNFPNAWGIWGAIVVGLVVGLTIGKSTEYFTSSTYRPTQQIAKSSTAGTGPVIITGFGTGMVSTVIPVVAVSVGIFFAFALASGFQLDNLNLGLYGIGFAAVGMLSTLGITLASDAYGPIADNAGGNAEMSGLGPEVRGRTDALDSLGNTTAAVGKGFAIASAALTALALIASYAGQVRTSLRMAEHQYLNMPSGERLPIDEAGILDLIHSFEVNLINPNVLIGLLIGSMMAFLFCGLTIHAVAKTASQMVEEVRRQFRETHGLFTGQATPDYERCVAISTKGAQKEILLPSLLAVIVPIGMGLIFGASGVMGLLIGTLATGFSLAVFMANVGGSWDNAKKYIEEGHFGGKGSQAHQAAVVGDTVGDPFKDTAGPSLNILIKLMSMVSIVMAGVIALYHLL